MDWITKILGDLQANHRLRVPKTLEHLDSVTATLDGQKLLVFCSNDYLGLRFNQQLRQAVLRGIAEQPIGTGASRLVSGDSTLLQSAERTFARFVGAQASLLCTSGFAANAGAIPAVAEREDVVFSDELNHASLIDGARLSRARIVVYPHKDSEELAKRITAARPFRRGWIVTESLFSMDGDLAPLRDLRTLADKEGLHLYVDEAHALGVYGSCGQGALHELGIDAELRLGTLGKALGSAGAFLAGPTALKQLLWNKSRSFVFSTGISPVLALAAMAAIELLQAENSPQQKLLENTRYLRTALATAGFELGGDTRSPILPLVLGADQRALEVSSALLEAGLFVQAIRPPTVPANTARLRITVSAAHTTEHLDRLVRALTAVC